ncbi:MAG TPA: hypothetical protein VK760_15765 [Candidatus Acidoferrales bacterium]|nr:hypothetical protein [Candidatus Acidoferrales bacterium]
MRLKNGCSAAYEQQQEEARGDTSGDLRRGAFREEAKDERQYAKSGEERRSEQPNQHEGTPSSSDPARHCVGDEQCKAWNEFCNGEPGGAAEQRTDHRSSVSAGRSSARRSGAYIRKTPQSFLEVFMKSLALALTLAASIAAPALADGMGTPSPSPKPSAMSGHMMSGHMTSSAKPSMKPSPKASSSSMMSGHSMMMASPKPTASPKS